MTRATGFSEIQAEMILGRAVRQFDPTIFNGVTDRAERLKRFRAAIAKHRLAHVQLDEKTATTFSQMFKTVYGEEV